MLSSSKLFEMEKQSHHSSLTCNPSSCDLMTSFRALLTYVNTTDHSSAVGILEIHTWVVSKLL